MDALIFADGDAPDPAYLDAHWPRWADDIALVVAADGGARHASAFGTRLDVWVGDGDSIDPATLTSLASAGVVMEHAPTDKDETDTELAIRAALRRDADGVIVIGATGGPRIDHELANLGLLAMPELAGHAATIYTIRSRVRLLRGLGAGVAGEAAVLDVHGAPGDLVSLISFGGAALGVTTDALRYPLRGETLAFGAPRGISNVVLEGGSRVSLMDGLLLVVETPATIRP